MRAVAPSVLTRRFAGLIVGEDLVAVPAETFDDLVRGF
ncbi:MAG: hypothetical protein ACI8TP_001520, partial [Acidimicrobiales bacterium]